MKLRLRSLLLTLFAITLSSVTAFSQIATIATDALDYPPGSTAIITGSGWQPGETVTLQVLHDPTGGDDATSPAHQPWTVVADASGNVSSTWYVPSDADELSATLQLTAIGGSSGLKASEVFTDAITRYPNGLSTSSNSQTVCLNNVAQAIIADLSTCDNGTGVVKNTDLVYNWYYNTTNSNSVSGATLVSSSSWLTTATTSNSYVPSSNVVGTRFYFCQVTFTPGNSGNGCGGSGRTGYPYTTSTVQITVNALPSPPTAVNYNADYDGNSHSGSATVNGLETVDWYANATGNAISTAPSGTNAGTYSAYAEARNTTTGCVSSSRTLVTVTINLRAATWTTNASSKTYGDADPSPLTTGSGTNFVAADNISATYTRAAGETVAGGPYHITATLVDPNNKLANYTITNTGADFTINLRAATWTTNASSKYCGQTDPSPLTTGSPSNFVAADGVTATYSRIAGETAAGSPYHITATLNSIVAGALNNYNITNNGNDFTVNAITSIDASGSSNAWPVGNTVTLTATITPAVSGVMVTFTVTPGGTYYGTTNIINGVATATTLVSGLGVGLYKVNAMAGSGCATSTDAYFSVYDPNAGFVTGGGWIMSPQNTSLQFMQDSGKANFGFNSQYKKGSNVPTGNTQFQFQAGNLNFNSSSYSAGSLVIAGARAIYQGVGTINGSGSYYFMVSAIDGSISGGGGSDKFRMKIWTNPDGTGIVYDNNSGADNNSDPTTILGGGSIVIHSTSSNKTALDNSLRTMISNEPEKFAVKVLPNPTSYYFTLGLKSVSTEKVSITVVDIMGRTVEQRSNVPANSTLQLGNGYHPGVYFAQVMQGKDMVIIKLIKQGK